MNSVANSEDLRRKSRDDFESVVAAVETHFPAGLPEQMAVENLSDLWGDLEHL